MQRREPAARIYHRKESPTQSRAVAAIQEASHEMWGSPAATSSRPTVKAFEGPLPQGARGIEFTTDVEPDPGGAPGRVEWSGPRQGVRVDGDIAKIDCVILRNTQL